MIAIQVGPPRGRTIAPRHAAGDQPIAGVRPMAALRISSATAAAVAGVEAPTWFRRGMLLFSVWVVLGAYSDTWAHHHMRLTSVVTPFHAVVFGGLLCEAAFMAWALRRFGAAPHRLRRAVPRGYGLAVGGCVLAVAAAPLDLGWHVVFGIDQGFGSVTSPTHIVIGCGTALMTTGPLRSALGGNARRATWAAVLSATLLWSMIFFFDEATHPFLAQWASNYYPRMMLPDTAEQLGAIEIVLWAALIAACVLPLALRFDLPFGAFTVLLGATGVLTTLIVAPQPIIIVGPAGGLVADELYRILRPARTRPTQMRLFACLVPASMTGLYFLILGAAGGTWWPVNVWAGCVSAAGITGVLVSLLVLPGALHQALPAASREL